MYQIFIRWIYEENPDTCVEVLWAASDSELISVVNCQRSSGYIVTDVKRNGLTA